MGDKELQTKIKKNLLDLKYNKYLQYLNTSIIILFTYFAGLALAFLTKQIRYNNLNQIGLALFTSVVITSILATFILRFRINLRELTKEISALEPQQE